MSNRYFTEEHKLFRESLKVFLKKEVVPYIEKWEKTGDIDRFIWEKFGEMGYFGIAYPEEYGGLDLDLFYTVILLEELQKINSGGFAAAIWAHAYLAMTHVNKEGDHRIKEEYSRRYSVLSNQNQILSSKANGYKIAFNTILDSNITTIATAIILYIFGTAAIRGFAITLSLGIMCSMFTAVFGTSIIAKAWYRTFQPKRLGL